MIGQQFSLLDLCRMGYSLETITEHSGMPMEKALLLLLEIVNSAQADHFTI